MKKVVIIQTRMGSTRLPGKVLYPLNGKPALEQVIDRVKKAKNVDEIVIATTEDERDQIIVEWAKDFGVSYYRGSESDVLSRYYYSAKETKADVVVRITSDCPLIDGKLLDSMLSYYEDNECLMLTNSGPDNSKRTFPRGLDVEIFRFSMLEEAMLNADADYEREHVTPYFYKNYSNQVHYYLNNVDYSSHRWTLDTIEDYMMISRVYSELINVDDANMNTILSFLENRSDLVKINSEVEQKKVAY